MINLIFLKFLYKIKVTVCQFNTHQFNLVIKPKINSHIIYINNYINLLLYYSSLNSPLSLSKIKFLYTFLYLNKFFYNWKIYTLTEKFKNRNNYFHKNRKFVNFYKSSFYLIPKLLLFNYFIYNLKDLIKLNKKYFNILIFSKNRDLSRNTLSYTIKFNFLKKLNFKHYTNNSINKINKTKFAYFKFINFNDLDYSVNFISNKYLINVLNIFNFNFVNIDLNNHLINNFYPMFSKKTDHIFFNRFKINQSHNYTYFVNKLIISFFEFTFKKRLFIKISNNYFNSFNSINSYYLSNLLLVYKNYNSRYFKNFNINISDFIQIIWYSFFLKDLNLLSLLISNSMEKMNFKNHKRFLVFFQNFITKYSILFSDVLKIKGFFFDIRGKVGVTGSSKKRHFCFNFGSLKRSSKDFRINQNNNLVRTYSGVLGLTYIICY